MCKSLFNSLGLGLFGLFFSAALFASPVKTHYEEAVDGPSRVVAEGVLKASPDAIWNQLIRINDYVQFMPRVIDSFFISEEGVDFLRSPPTRNGNKLCHLAAKYKVQSPRKKGSIWEAPVFMVLDAPFPVENRWYVIRVTHDESKAKEHIYRRSWKLEEGVGNIDYAQGFWEFKPWQESLGSTLAHYEDQVDAGGSVPKWVTRLGATQTVPDFFRSLEKEAHQAQDVDVAGKIQPLQ